MPLLSTRNLRLERNQPSGDQPQTPTHQSAEPPVNGLPRTKMNRQHFPATARAGKIAQHIGELTKIGRPFPAVPVRMRHQGR